jgi:hypothetical protein
VKVVEEEERDEEKAEEAKACSGSENLNFSGFKFCVNSVPRFRKIICCKHAIEKMQTAGSDGWTIALAYHEY